MRDSADFYNLNGEETEYNFLMQFLDSLELCYPNLQVRTYGDNMCLFRIKGIEIDNNIRYILENSIILHEQKSRFTHVFYCHI